MKKARIPILLLSFMLCLCACGTNNSTTTDTEKTITTNNSSVETQVSSETVAASSAPSQAETKTSNTVSSDFKVTMDSYEAFFDKYIDICNKYKSNPTDMTVMAEYTKYMGQCADMLNKMNALKSNSLSSADLAYYLEVNARITKKLASIS